jgi:hypothetical protein
MVELQPLQSPLIFVHIPKTSGTSLITVLSNLYGDHRVRRLAPSHCHADSITEIMCSPTRLELRCITGHFPISALGEGRKTLGIITVLRHPIDRVMSLYRFLRHRCAAELAELGLTEGFSFEAFLASRSPALFGQVRNGMCRMLCESPEMSDPESDSFWAVPMSGAIVESALETLKSSTFGLMEELPATLQLLREALRAPFGLVEHFENRSDEPGPEWTTQNVMQLVELNSADLALYHEAARLFEIRKKRLARGNSRQELCLSETNILRLNIGHGVSISEIASRQGFYTYESTLGFSWLVGDVPAYLVFAASGDRLKLCLDIYKVAEQYAVEELVVSVNEISLAHCWLPIDARRGLLQTEVFSSAEVNFLKIEVPYSVPVRLLEPTSLDRRQLSIAISSIQLIEA